MSQKETYEHRFIEMFMKHNNITFCLKIHYFTINAVLLTHLLKFSNLVNCPLYILEIYSWPTTKSKFLFNCSNIRIFFVICHRAQNHQKHINNNHSQQYKSNNFPYSFTPSILKRQLFTDLRKLF